ncbi:hypothetical protein [Embleya sp. NPDC020886]|uniref:hypothetical protein n=1 Tax=Embleya sp. NPDC020886 TaxID=3363980 RepID=UPI0037AF7B64
MSAYEPPPPPEARGLRLGDLVRRRRLADPDDEEPAFPAPRHDRADKPSGRAASGPERESRASRDEDEPSWRRDLRERRKHERETAARAETRRTTERASDASARPGRAAAARRAEEAQAQGRRTQAQRAEGGAAGVADRSARPPVRHVMKPRDPGRHNAPATPAESARKLPWRKSAKAAGPIAGAAGAGPAAETAGGSTAASGLARFVRRGPAAAAADDAADSGTQGGSSGIPKVQPPFAGAAEGSAGPSRGPFGGTDLIMLVPAGFAAYYGAGLLVSCSSEANFMAAFCLWLMMGFWIVIVSAKWPLLRLMRWAWVLAGLMAGASIPIGGG